MFQKFIISIAFIFITIFSFAQTADTIQSVVVDYTKPAVYEVGGVTVSGVQFIDPGVLISMSGFAPGRKITIPSDEITKIVEKFWSQGLFSDVKISITKMVGDKVF